MKKIYICPEMFSEEVSAACALLQESKTEGINLSDGTTQTPYENTNGEEFGGFGTKDRVGDFGDDSWGSLW